MNDRYLFRAKRKNWKQLPKEMWWVEGYLYGIWERRYILWGMINDVPNMVEVDPSTICQCTGLKDKNGKLIWENDVVKCVDVNAETEFFAVVEFGNPNGFYSWGYQLKHIYGDEPNLDILLWIDMDEAGATCEIIGKIFDEGSENIGKRAEEN